MIYEIYPLTFSQIVKNPHSNVQMENALIYHYTVISMMIAEITLMNNSVVSGKDTLRLLIDFLVKIEFTRHPIVWISDDNRGFIFAVLQSCKPDEFRCNNGQCILMSQKCDFRKDCTDGSDEVRDLCGKLWVAT